MNPGSGRGSEAVIDLEAVAHNVSVLKEHAGQRRFCAVVKADAYGHGAVRVAPAALAGGADCLAVALVEEAAELRAAGITAGILLLSEPPPGSEEDVVSLDLEPMVYSREVLDRLSDAALLCGATVPVHLKVNTGMNRVGADPDDITELARQAHASAGVRLAGVCTHFAVADEPENPATREQARIFSEILVRLRDTGVDAGVRHAANTAATLVDPDRLGYDMVRCGIGIYGIPPAPALEGILPLEPVMSLRSRLSHVAFLPAGSSISYGHRYRLDRDSWIGTVPLGYADGVRRGLSGCMHVLVGGRRRPIAGTVTMDQFMVDLGEEEHRRGEEVVLIGAQGDEAVTAQDWAEAVGSISYEITCGISPRVPRRFVMAATGHPERVVSEA